MTNDFSHVDSGHSASLLPVPMPRARRRPASPVAPPAWAGAPALVAAVELLLLRGGGPNSWAMSLRDDPLAFLLDIAGETIGITLWSQSGQPLYQSHAAEKFDAGSAQPASLEQIIVGGRRFERRCLEFHCGASDCMLEIICEQTGN